MKIASTVALFFFASIPFVACSDKASSDAQDGPSSPCDIYASRLCAKVSECLPVGFRLASGDIANCIAQASKECSAQLSLPGVNVSNDAVLACSAAIAAATCDVLASNVGPAGCTFVGTRPAGAACVDASQCATPRCVGASSTTCGTCGGPKSDGEKCTSTSECEDGHDCFSTGVCGQKVALGGSCQLRDQCADGLGCVGAKCVTQVPVGAACQSSGYCFENEGVDCIDGTCAQRIVVASAGQACGTVGSTTVRCAGRAPCVSGVCAEFLTDGSACSLGPKGENPCAGSGRCVNGTCQTNIPSCN